MNEYNIYTNTFDKYIAVKQGWSWMAFIFIWMYAFVKSKCMIGLLTLVASVEAHTENGAIAEYMRSVKNG